MTRYAVALLLLVSAACDEVATPAFGPADAATVTNVVPHADAAVSVDADLGPQTVPLPPEPEDDAVSSGDDPTTHRVLLKTLKMPWEREPGVVPGFDLDDRVSDGNGADDCDWGDFQSPDGEAGVDNQLAILTPLFEPVGLGQIFAYLENSIEDSGFFLMFELRGVDSFTSDGEVDFIYEVGGGSALMDPEGDLVANQTMCIQTDSPHTVARLARIEDGKLFARFDYLTIPFVMFERVYPLAMRDVRLSARVTPEGWLTEGVVGGTLAMSNILELVTKGAQNTGGLLGPAQALLDGLGDMPSEAGPCTAMSTALEFSAVPVFFHPKDSGCDPCGNDTCEYFESCETCLVDCCAGCGNGMCDEYPAERHDVTVTMDGFGPADLDLLVGDTIVWTNGAEASLNLVCEGVFETERLAPGETFTQVIQTGGAYSCRTYELPGRFNQLMVDDNHSENCQSCPGDCGVCE